jgi:hypothetical protein
LRLRSIAPPAGELTRERRNALFAAAAPGINLMINARAVGRQIAAQAKSKSAVSANGGWPVVPDPFIPSIPVNPSGKTKPVLNSDTNPMKGMNRDSDRQSSTRCITSRAPTPAAIEAVS